MISARRSCRPGFTLIELFVVLVIILILAALLFPVFARARERARQTVCLNDIREMGAAALIYVQDYDGAFPAQAVNDVGYYNDPPGTITNDCVREAGGADIPSWAGEIEIYLKDPRLLVCPSAQDITCAVASIPPTANSRVSYFYNGLVSGGTLSDPMPAATLSAVYRPAELILFWEWGRASTSAASLSPRWTGSRWKITGWQRNPNTIWFPTAPHFWGSNAGFADGHIKYVLASNLFPGHLMKDRTLGSGDQVRQSRSLFNPYKH